jgi:hypothetical protein
MNGPSTPGLQQHAYQPTDQHWPTPEHHTEHRAHRIVPKRFHHKYWASTSTNHKSPFMLDNIKGNPEFSPGFNQRRDACFCRLYEEVQDHCSRESQVLSPWQTAQKYRYIWSEGAEAAQAQNP